MTIAERLRQEGLQQGLQKGTYNEALRIARMMLANGIALDTVLRITGLSAADVLEKSH